MVIVVCDHTQTQQLPQQPQGARSRHGLKCDTGNTTICILDALQAIDGQTVTIHEADGVESITVYLHDALLDLDQPVILRFGDRVLNAKIYRDSQIIKSTMRDPSDYYTASVTFQLQ